MVLHGKCLVILMLREMNDSYMIFGVQTWPSNDLVACFVFFYISVLLHCILLNGFCSYTWGASFGVSLSFGT